MNKSFPLTGSQPVSPRLTRVNRFGFTLIEMLVSAALTVLIMSLFAQVFALATGSITDQRNIARHDQKARVVAQSLNLDLAGRTFRQRESASGLSLGIVPLVPGIPIDRARQRGYFYYSENDPRNNVDDVLQFTVDLREVDLRVGAGDDPPPTSFVGRATDIARSGALVARPVSSADTDQPEWDDGVGSRTNAVGTLLPGNGQTQSPAAEVSYFVRGGNLYRRVLLLRDPANPASDGQPAALGGAGPLMSLLKNVDDGIQSVLPDSYLGGSWYNDFDVSATRYEFDPEGDGDDTGGPNRDGDGDGVSADTTAIYVHTLDSLDNVSGKLPLGLPWHRFGHMPLADRDVDDNLATDFATAFELRDESNNPYVNSISGANELLSYVAGQPYEFLKRGAATSERTYIGRFTQGETSSPVFNFPDSVLAATGHPYHTSVLELDDELADSDGSEASNQDPFLVDEFEAAGMPREGEDLVLTNVLGFDVEIWDDVLAAYVDLGQNSTAGAFADGGVYTDSVPGVAAVGFQNASRKFSGYGPSIPSFNRVFDTWHPGTNQQPPIVVTRRQVESATSGLTGTNQGVAGLRFLPAGRRNTQGNNYEGVWDSANTYQLNDTVIPDTSIPPYAAATVTYGEAPPAPTTAATEPVTSQISNRLFRAIPFNFSTGVAVGGSVQVSNVQPNWEDAVINGFVDQGALAGGNVGIRWVPVDDGGRAGFNATEADELVGLKKLRVTVTIADPKTGSIRDLTLIHSFVE